ncbi:early nodulin-75-like [Ostrinia furnacalis]|uniref:early nodulin-75-like n=1 Tax=Ostrinia furnacalis TaxID=93504 RepID=UPI00103DEC62|nr:early nodulin-75-like [Ostrinia furnacalis]
MQIGDCLCYLLLMITVTSTCVKAEDDRQKRELSIGKSKRLLKRDAAILIDNFPVEPVYTHKPKVIYRRVSRQRYGPPKPKPKYGPPRPKYGPPPKLRKPAKKYRKQISTKYGPPSHKKRTSKPRYGPPKRPTNKPIYGPPKKVPSHYYTPEPAGFAEPPADYEPHPQPHQNYAEPPVDSYGAPLKTTVSDVYPTAQAYENPNYFENQDFGQEYQSWQNYGREPNQDNSYAYSKKRPLFVKPDEMFDSPQNQEEDFNLNSYSDAFTYSQNFKEPQYLHNKRKKPQYFTDTNKQVNKHWKAPRFRQENKPEPDDEILVGGQYAEPPPRYVPKFQPSAPMFNGEDDFAPPQSFLDSEVAASATISPYVNYKHSNMAFSPQNLNDAFSIVDK